ncbi:MAG: ATP-binding protein [Planctomycetota bacterium]
MSVPSPQNLALRESPPTWQSEPKPCALWIARLRFGAGAALLLASVLALSLGVVEGATPLLVIGAAILAYNTLLVAVIRRAGPVSAEEAQRVWFGQILADVVVLTALLYFCGGIENPVAALYVLPMLCAGVLLPARLSYCAAALATALFGGVGTLQAAFPSLYHSLGLGFWGQQFRRWPVVGVETAALAGALFGAVYISRTIRRHLRAAEKRITESGDVLNSVIASISEELIFLSPQGEVLLRNRAIEGLSTVAEELPAGLRHYLERVRSAAEPLPPETFPVEVPEGRNQPVRQVLAFSRPATTERVPADLDDLIEQTVRMLSYGQSARRVHMQSIRCEDLPQVRIAPQHFQQVLVNLLLNAVDAVQGVDGEPTVTVERRPNGNWVEVLVSDNGCGMGPQQVNRAFEPFYSTKPPGEGTGLGLAVSYRLVERQGGRIHIQSAPGEGTVVTLAFLAERSAEKKQVADMGAPEGHQAVPEV